MQVFSYMGKLYVHVLQISMTQMTIFNDCRVNSVIMYFQIKSGKRVE